VFTSTADLLGSNPDLSRELYAVAWDGTGLRQLTDLSAGVDGPTVSDDGARIAFVSDGDPLGSNPDGSTELFAIASDGTGLRQLTAAPAGSSCAFPWIAGNGSRVAVQCDADLTGGNADLGDEVFLVEWGNGAVTQLTASTALVGEPFAGAPSMTDDGELVFYHSNTNSFLTNIDGNVEIWRIARDGTGRTALTSTALDIGSLLPVASGDGSRVTFVSISDPTGGNPDGNLELYLMTGNGAEEEQITETVWGWTTSVDVTADGERIVFASSAALDGLNPERNEEVFAMDRDGGGLLALTPSISGSSSAPAIADDGSLVAFASDADLTGGNADGSTEIFVVGPDGLGLVQLTTAGGLDGDSGSPALSGNGTWVAFTSDTDPLGTNADGNVELFAIRTDGTGLIQLTATTTGTARAPDVDGSGAWIAFSHSGEPLPGGNPEGNRELFVVGTDGTGLGQVTATAAGTSDAPALTADGATIAFRSTADFDGANADGNAEIHRVARDGTDRVRLTETASGSNGAPSWTDDDATITFTSSAPFAGPNPDGLVDTWRIDASDGGGLVRRTANRLGGLPGGADALLGGGSSMAAAASGRVIVLGLGGDPVGRNPDLVPETFVIDLDVPWTVRPQAADPTVWTWNARAGARVYDLARGDLAALASDGDGVSLGAVLCLADDRPDLDSAATSDPDIPAPGSGFFYVVRPDDRLVEPSYGTGSAGGERRATGGDCTP
jgi:Tol biopolymer transport system component